MTKIPLPEREIHSKEDLEKYLLEVQWLTSTAGRSMYEIVYMKDDEGNRLRSVPGDVPQAYIKQGQEPEQLATTRELSILAHDILEDGTEITEEEYNA